MAALLPASAVAPRRLARGSGVHEPDPFAPVLARAIRVLPGVSALDLGCGAGFYALDLARRGASPVVATDLDPAAVRATRANARRLGLRLETAEGDLFAPVRGRRFDVIVANLPQCPSTTPLPLARWGGPDGLRHLRRLARGAPRHLASGGSLWFLATGWIDGDDLARAFAGFALRPRVVLHRTVTRADYERLAPGLFERLRDGVARRPAALRRVGGRWRLTLTFYEARIRPAPAPMPPAIRTPRV